MFERFTELGKQVTVLAQEEARRADHAHIGADHLLLGVLANPAGAGFQLLEHLKVDVLDLRDVVRAKIGRGQGSPAYLQFTAAANKALELSLREALRLGDNCIGSEHIVLGLLREGTGQGARILRERGIGVPEAEAGLAGIERESLAPGDETRKRWWRRR